MAWHGPLNDASSQQAKEANQLDLLQWTKNAAVESKENTAQEVNQDISPITSASSGGLHTDLLNACLELSTAVANFVQKRRPDWTAKQRARYAESNGRLCLWKDNTLDGRLEVCLNGSPDLYRSILELLCALGQTLLNGNFITSLTIPA